MAKSNGISKSSEKSEELSLEISDCTNTAEDLNCGAGLNFLKVLIQYGRISSVFSYSIVKMYNGKGLNYSIRRSRLAGAMSWLAYSFICIHFAIVVINFDFNVSYSKLVNMIKRVTYGVFVFKLVIMYYCLEYRGWRQGIWVKILNQADCLQEKFAKFGIYLPANAKGCILSTGICTLSIILCIVHIMVFSFGQIQQHSENCEIWYEYYAFKVLRTLTLGLCDLDVGALNPTFSLLLGTFGLTLELFSWNLWYFGDALRVGTALMVWIVFRKLNLALADGKLGVDNLSDVMELHFGGVKLLNLMNQLMSPITMSASVFNILYVCFWTNYCLISFQFRLTHIVGFITILRMVTVFYFLADVNSQAYQISTWLEDNFTKLDTVPKEVDRTKLALFTSVIYTRETIGFKGMNFFTVTPALNIAIAGLVLTYTFVVNQVASSGK